MSNNWQPSEVVFSRFDLQVDIRTLEVLYPYLERAADNCDFETDRIATEVANVRNQVWCRLQAAGREPEGS